MVLKVKIRLLLHVCLIALLFTLCEGKRGGGGRRGGTYRGSSSVWSKSKQSQSGSNYDLYNSRGKSKNQPQPEVAKKATAPVDTPKASAPPAPPKNNDAKQTSGAFLDQEKNHNQQKPIGWDTQNKNNPTNTHQQPIGWNVNSDSGSVNKQSVSSLGSSNSGNPSPPYSPGTGQHSYGNPPPYSPSTGQHNYGNPPAYSPGAGQSNYGQPPAYSPGINYGNSPPYSYGAGQHAYGNPPAYGSGIPQQNFGTPYGPGYSNQYNPHQTVPNYGGGSYNPYGGGYGAQNTGGLGSLFGGNKYGGYGGFGGHGVGGYGQKFGGGFGSGFGKNAYRNLAIGLLVWNLVSGFTRRPYYVYNYYNNPEKVPQEIPLPANAIVMCPENITTLCAPNTLPLCTTQQSIYCVALAQQTVPCGENSTMKCVNSTVTCNESDDDNCKEFKNKTETNTVSVPCVSSVTVTGNVSESAIPLVNTGNSTNFCVTTMAIPQPDEDIKKSEELKCSSNSTEVDQATCPGGPTNPLMPVGISLNSTTSSTSGSNETYPLAM
ncbi:hypothetical protein RI129_005989 [Pyrocoelia pectoralis]|uniref:Uncharacterized protein n=1 Tax=Pyrocoelia pectoralis TaxID=417401 RepID=A0AAN7VJD6_9COLE